MEKVKYHPEAGREVEFDVLKKNENGTIDIGVADGPGGKPLLVVSGCEVTAEIKIGAATKIKSEDAPGKPKSK